MPAILKEWQHLVLEYGFAHGQGGVALAGRLAFNAVTAGAPRKSDSRTGAGNAELRSLLLPVEKTLEMARLETCLPPWSGLPGRPAAERVAQARAFVAKTVRNLPSPCVGPVQEGDDAGGIPF